MKTNMSVVYRNKDDKLSVESVDLDRGLVDGADLARLIGKVTEDIGNGTFQALFEANPAEFIGSWLLVNRLYQFTMEPFETSLILEKLDEVVES